MLCQAMECIHLVLVKGLIEMREGLQGKLVSLKFNSNVLAHQISDQSAQKFKAGRLIRWYRSATYPLRRFFRGCIESRACANRPQLLANEFLWNINLINLRGASFLDGIFLAYWDHCIAVPLGIPLPVEPGRFEAVL